MFTTRAYIFIISVKTVVGLETRSDYGTSISNCPDGRVCAYCFSRFQKFIRAVPKAESLTVFNAVVTGKAFPVFYEQALFGSGL